MVSRLYDGAIVALGVCLALGATVRMFLHGPAMPWIALVCIPLIVVIARFPMLLQRGGGGIEVGFDSCVLMFLVCTLRPDEALVLWALGVTLTQVLADKTTHVKLFNIGVGMLGGALATAIITGLRGVERSTPQELLAVTLGAAGYFATDFVLSARAISLQQRSRLLPELVQPGTLVAVACFVPFDSMGYLGAVLVRAVMARASEWWTLGLLAVPLATLLVATRAVNRGGENSRRLSLLFEAAVRAQTLTEPRKVLDVLVDDARRLLRMKEVEVRATPPGPHEIGAQVRDGQQERWIVAPAQNRPMSTVAADQTALEAMAAVSSDAFARLRLTEDMTHLARHDVLTNLPNRGLLLDRVEHALQMSRRRGSRVALLFCDLDGFKPVNDRFGHAAGDAVLVDVAQRLTACVRESDTVARLGGDEFAILLPHADRKAAELVAADVVDRVRAEVRSHDDTRRRVSVSLGGATVEPVHTSATELLSAADAAMYVAKNSGRDRYAFLSIAQSV
ncbi:MAG TPA: GGDEF domain-containing protein [Nocardioidaceae bacterium]